jgi:hypothetical protein
MVQKFQFTQDAELIPQIESIYQNAIQAALERETTVIHLRSLNSLAKFYKTAGTQMQKEDMKEQLLQLIKTLPKNLPDLKVAQKLAEELTFS